MSITDLGKVDLVATRPGSRVVKLVITDHLRWDDFPAHAELLQEKINSYLEFIESGQLAALKNPLIPESPEIWITLAAEWPPSTQAQAFLAQINEFLGSAGLRFEVQQR